MGEEEEAERPPAGGLGAASGTSGGEIGPVASRSASRLGAPVLIGIAGVLGVLGFAAYRKRELMVKEVEARSSLGQIGKQAAEAWERESYGVQGAEVTTHRLCPSAGPIPRDLAAVRGKRYASSPADWSGDEGWRCLRFERSAPQWYQYAYESERETLRATAVGDVDGDGVTSRFALVGGVQKDRFGLRYTIVETDPDE